MVTQPVQTRSQLKIRQILSAAKQELIENGYQNFTTNRVADSAKCNIGTVYRYFVSKEDIIAALYKEWLGEIHKKAVEVVNRLEENADLAQTTVKLFEAFCSKDNNEHRLAIELTKAETMSHTLKQASTQHDVQIHQAIATIVEQKIGQRLADSKAVYLHDLMLSMMLMVSLAAPKERADYISNSSQVLVMLVKSWQIVECDRVADARTVFFKESTHRDKRSDAHA